MRIVIVGAGAVGGLLGALLARAGHQISFVARGKTLDRIREKGLRVTLASESFDVGPFEADVDPARLAPADAVFVTVKSWQVQALAGLLPPLLKPGSVVVPVQNGVEAADLLAAACGDAVLGGVCHVLASSERPGEIATNGPPLKLTLGELGGGASPRIESLAAVLRAAGATVSVSDDIRAALWEKLLFVGPLGMIGAATRLSVDQFRAVPESRALLVEAMSEVRGVAKAQGVVVPEEAPARSLTRVDSLPAGSTTSMHRDLEAGRPSELEAQVGAIVRLAKDLVPVSVHRTLYGVLVPGERDARAVASSS